MSSTHFIERGGYVGNQGTNKNASGNSMYDIIQYIAECEPILQYAMDFCSALTLGDGVKVSIAKQKPSPEFQKFFDTYFVSLMRHVLRYKVYCGFLPVVVKRLPVYGDRIPVLLPIGTFSWTTSVNMEGIKRKRPRPGSNVSYDRTSMARYNVVPHVQTGIEAEEVLVIELVQPTIYPGSFEGTANPSGLGPTFNLRSSLLYMAASRFTDLIETKRRIAWADDWNCTARLFTKRTPPVVQNERIGHDDIPFGSTRFQQAMMPDGVFSYDNQRIQFKTYSDMFKDSVEESNNENGSLHNPVVYSLPTHHDLLNMPRLYPLQDVKSLEEEYRACLAHTLGIPQQLLSQDPGHSKGISADQLPLMSEMIRTTCKDLAALLHKCLVHMYTFVYHPRDYVASDRIRLEFQINTLYSTELQQREDERILLGKGFAHPDSKASEFKNLDPPVQAGAKSRRA